MLGNEDVYTNLQPETEFFQQNASIFQHDFALLIEENKRLSEQLQNAKLDMQEEFGGEIQKLRQKLIAVGMERDSAVTLWKSAQKTIEALEEEMRVYQNDIDGTPQSRSDLETKFLTSLEQLNELEAKLKNIESEKLLLENELKLKDKDIEMYKERGKEFHDAKIQLENVREELITIKLQRRGDTEKLEAVKNEMETWKRKENEARSKVCEALNLLEMTFIEKHSVTQLLAVQEDNVKNLTDKLANVSKEADARFREELQKYKDSFNEKIGDMLAHIHTLDEQLEKKELLVEKLSREKAILEEANKLYEKQECYKLDPLLQGAEKRLEAAFQELILSERRNIKLSTEKQCLVMDMQRVRDQHKRELKRRGWEEGLLRGEIVELKNRIVHLQKFLDETHAMIDKLQKTSVSKCDVQDHLREESAVYEKSNTDH